MRPAVYLPVTEQGGPGANENSGSLFGQELCESVGLPPGLYKAPDPDHQHHSRNSSRAYSSEDDPPSPTRTSRACSSGARPRTGIIYPLQPRQRRPDTCIQTSLGLHSVLDASGDENALPRYTAQPNAHLHGGAGVFCK